jgi:Arc/MetJ-type ribon-helix-helix transcriptional regulator
MKTVSVGPVRIPKSYKEGLEKLLKDHVTYSDLIREAIYLLLKKKGIIKDD